MSKNICISFGEYKGAAYVATVWMPWLKRLVDGLSPRRHLFNTRSAHMGFEVNKVSG